MFTARADIDIDAPPRVVWEVLTDLDRWSEWSTWLAHEGGTLAVGAHLKLKLTPPGGGGWSFSPEVLALDDGKRFAWVGRAGIAGVFDGEVEVKERAEALFRER